MITISSGGGSFLGPELTEIAVLLERDGAKLFLVRRKKIHKDTGHITNK